MGSPWNAPYFEPTQPTRASRVTCLPPHLRSPISDPVGDFNRYARGGGTARGRGRGRGGGGGKRGPARPRNPGLNSHSGQDPDPFRKSDAVETEEDAANVNAYDDVPVETNGTDIPEPVRSFSELEFCEGLSENIRRCKYVKPTPIQRYAIPVAMAGRDLMACAQTGSGKTAAFCFPIINGILQNQCERPSDGTGRRGGYRNFRAATPLALILAPTRELASQIYDEAKKFSYETGLKIVVAYGGAPIVQQLRNLEKGVDILVATPGRLVDLMEKSRVSLSEIKYLALDEADRMLDMGFERQVRKIVQQSEMPPPGKRQTMLFSATFPAEIQSQACDFLSNYIFLSAGKVGSSTDLIAQKVEFVHESDKKDFLRNLLREQTANGTEGKSLTLVFVETKRGADALERWLSGIGFRAVAIHGDKEQTERERTLKSFRSGRTPILVATDVASRGLDIPHVSHVINFDLPRSIDYYVHRIGRTGRAGKSGLATALFSSKNASLAKDLVELMQGANQEIPAWLNDYVGGEGERVNSYGDNKYGGSYDHGNSAASENFSPNWSSQYTESAASPYYGYAAESSPFSYAAPFGAASDSFGDNWSTQYIETAPYYGYTADSNPFPYGATYSAASGNYGVERAPIAANDWV